MPPQDLPAERLHVGQIGSVALFGQTAASDCGINLCLSATLGLGVHDHGQHACRDCRPELEICVEKKRERLRYEHAPYHYQLCEPMLSDNAKVEDDVNTMLTSVDQRRSFSRIFFIYQLIKERRCNRRASCPISLRLHC
jgi:hypothetical protein